MALSIEDEETCLAAARLAAVTGQSLTEAIKQAVEEKLARLQTSEDQIERILTSGKDCAARIPKHLRDVSHGDLLYGPDGLPK
jgi:antitoxin VapB